MRLDSIEGDRISLVFQGPISHGVEFAARLGGARRAMPRAEIVISTWAGTAIDPSWPVDRVVFSDDPGPIYVEPIVSAPNNVMRQALSTVAGIAASTRPFVAKVRTDFGFTASALPLGPAIAGDAPLRVVTRPLTIVAAATRDPYTSSMAFHPSDFFTFGTRDDVARLWAFAREPLSLARPFISHWERLRVWRYGVVSGRFVPEQELALSLLRRSGCADVADRVRHFYITDSALRAASLAFLATNYRAFAWDRLGLVPPQRLIENRALYLGNVAADGDTGEIRRSPIDDFAKLRRSQMLQTATVLLGAPFGRRATRELVRRSLELKQKLKR